MSELNLEECIIYLDIIICSADIDWHLERLDAVFKRLVEFNLTIKPNKCEFFKTETTYLGRRCLVREFKPIPRRRTRFTVGQ